MKNFVAIDFETANYEPTSICSVGLVVVRGGEITQRMHRLVCPEPDYFRTSTRHLSGRYLRGSHVRRGMERNRSVGRGATFRRP